MTPDEAYADNRGDLERQDSQEKSESRYDPDQENRPKPGQNKVRDDKPDSSGDSDEKSRGKKRKRKPTVFQKPLFKIGVAVAAVILLIGGLIWWWIARQYESTDDAFVDTHIVQISPQIAGIVTRVSINDNDLVNEGEPLVEIDLADARARMEQVQAQEAQAETQYQQAIANAAAADAQFDNAGRDLERYRALQRTMPGAVSQQQIDAAVAAARNAAAQRDAARAQIAGAAAQVDVYKAQIAAAQLNLGYTHIVAPIDGHIAQRNAAPGNYVSAGQQLMAIVPLQLWVTANFKETQLSHMRVGQAVSIGIDACGGIKAKGHIDSFQRGAGQAFGILPPENATGNFVKVVQRVPVKIVFDNLPDGCPLGPGMSVEPRVKVR